jgi:hypothetical protein
MEEVSSIKKQEKALNEEGEAENILDTTPVAEEEASVEVPEPEATPEATEQVEEAVAEEPEQETEESKKKGYSQRVRELNTRAKEAEAKYESLAERMAILTGNVPGAVPQPEPTVDEPIIQPGEEIDGTELDKRLRQREAKILQRADALVTLRNKQSDAVNRINEEARDVVKKYPELDPDSDQYKKELSESVTEAVEAYAKADPYNASVKTFVAKLMKPYQMAVAKEVGQASENIAKQVSETALRPTSVRQPEKSASEMTPEELEQKLGVVQT